MKPDYPQEDEWISLIAPETRNGWLVGHYSWLQPGQSGGEQKAGVYRLGDEVVHARLEAARLVFGKSIGGHRQDRSLTTLR